MAEKKVTRSQVVDKEDETSALLKEVRLVNTKIDNIEERLTSRVDALGISLERTLKQELKKMKDDFDSEKSADSNPEGNNENLADKIEEVIEDGCACDDGVTLVALLCAHEDQAPAW
ncbi:unnamed protein product [Leuciscus chuanchicus]